MIKILNFDEEEIDLTNSIKVESPKGSMTILPNHENIIFKGFLPKYKIQGMFFFEDNQLNILYQDS